MDLTKKQIGKLLKLADKYVVIDKATYHPDYPNDLKVSKFLAPDHIDFTGHISDYPVYPDYAIAKMVNQGIRLPIYLLYPKLKDIPVGMIEHTKLRGAALPKRSDDRSDREVAREKQDSKV